jgi:hypothetical protein
MQLSKRIAAVVCLLVVLLFSHCNRQTPYPASDFISLSDSSAVFFPFFLSDKTMVVNQEQDNEMEGHYLKILKVINDSTFKINLPAHFYLNNKNDSAWAFGWPTGKPYYDAGNENLRELISIDTITNQIILGKLLRGKGYPGINQRVVFWNRSPSGFKNFDKGKIINPEWWKTFAGKSIEFGAIIFDNVRAQWVMYLQEVDTRHVQIYAAISSDLIHWKAFKNGETLLKPKDFKNAEWAGLAEDGVTPQTARIYSAIFENGKYFFFLSGYGKDGKRHIGLITSNDPLNGPFTVSPKPLISPNTYGYDVRGCFYPKVCRMGNKFLLYYDGVGEDGTENLCLAESQNLLNWKKFNHNPVIEKHYGWRSGRFTSEPDYIQCSNDSIWIMIGGYKKYNTDFSSLDSNQNRLPHDKSIFSSAEREKGQHISGNVMDAELGVFLSIDGGHSFRPHINNPVWLNDYGDSLQNDHLGGDFFRQGNIILYQAKSEAQKRYNVLMRRK